MDRGSGRRGLRKDTATSYPIDLTVHPQRYDPGPEPGLSRGEAVPVSV